jgi:hypothetical protein
MHLCPYISTDTIWIIHFCHISLHISLSGFCILLCYREKGGGLRTCVRVCMCVCVGLSLEPMFLLSLLPLTQLSFLMSNIFLLKYIALNFLTSVENLPARNKVMNYVPFQCLTKKTWIHFSVSYICIIFMK